MSVDQRDRAEQKVVAALREVYTERGVRLWLDSFNHRLTGVPAELLDRGYYDHVVREAERVGGVG